VVTLPHLGASTEEAEENCAIMVAEQVRDYLENGNVLNSVNFPKVSMPRDRSFRLAIANANVPNMLGQISTVLAAAGLNIHDMVNKSRATWPTPGRRRQRRSQRRIASIEGSNSVRCHRPACARPCVAVRYLPGMMPTTVQLKDCASASIAIDDRSWKLLNERARWRRRSDAPSAAKRFYRPEREAEICAPGRERNPGRSATRSNAADPRGHVGLPALELPTCASPTSGRRAPSAQAAALKHFGHDVSTLPRPTSTTCFHAVETGRVPTSPWCRWRTRPKA
jgi:hypothetical protein